MRRAASASVLLSLFMIVLVSISFNVRYARAENGDYTIERIKHSIEVTYNGYVFINDTVTLNGQLPESFLIGFPHQYGPYVVRCFAYNLNTDFPVVLDVPLENHIGYYAVKVDFSKVVPQEFTVGFVFSNSLLTQDTQNASIYTLDFPAFPSLTKVITFCNSSIDLPVEASYLSGTAFAYSAENVPAFTHNASSVTFLLPDNKLQLFDVTRMEREISVTTLGEVIGSDTYYMTNKAPYTISTVEITMPAGISNPTAEDQLGRKMADPTQIPENTSRYLINFTLQIRNGESNGFTVSYHLPSSSLKTEGVNRFALNLVLFHNENCYINQASVTFILPEGAKMIQLEGNLADNITSISRSIYQETVTVSKTGIFASDTLSVQLVYEYNALWLSFRPTMWVWMLAVVGSIFVAAWKRPKELIKVSAHVTASKLHPEHLKSFIDAYEEKKKIVSEIDSLGARVQKGKIPRRRYKVMRRTLEARMSTLLGTLAEFKERASAAGGQYVDLVRRLEIAETEINDAETNVKSIEARYNRGEVSLEAYRKLQADYDRRKKNAETTINGILLRLREETH